MAERRYTLSFTEAELGTLVSALRVAGDGYKFAAELAAAEKRPHWQAFTMAFRCAALDGRIDAALAILNEQQAGA